MDDSYSATRIQVMRTKLIKEAEYARLLKMSESEILTFLQATEYKEDVEALALKDFDDLEVIDKIIARNNDRVLAKLQRISSENFNITLNTFLMENDIWNLKVIAEAITSKADPKQMLDRYAKRGTFNPQTFANATTIEELSKLASTRMHTLRKRITTLPEFIDALNMTHNERSPHLIDEENILGLLMRKREKMPPEQILARLSRGGTIPISALKPAAQAATLQDSLHTLSATKYGKAFAQEGMVNVEAAFHHEILKRVRKVAGISPLDPTVVIRYLIEKDIEITNLRLLIKGKHLGLEEAFLREQLVI